MKNTIVGKYLVHEQIGEGGFGAVHRAVRQADGVQVAIKFLHEGAGADERHRFEREVRMIQGHNHPKIVELLDHDVTGARPYYVMPYMRGGTLTRWAGKLPFANARSVLKGLVDVLAYLHVNGSIHRDLKPDNVLVDDDGKIAVCDFGLGNSPRFTVMFTVSASGTPGYAAPELFIRGGLASQASDIYSLGATLFHMLSGVHPHGATSLDPGTYVPSVPDDLRSLVAQMMNPDPLRRPKASDLCGLLGLPMPRPSALSEPVRGGYTPRREATTVGGGRYG